MPDGQQVGSPHRASTRLEKGALPAG
jgi:hypothetical protein